MAAYEPTDLVPCCACWPAAGATPEVLESSQRSLNCSRSLREVFRPGAARAPAFRECLYLSLIEAVEPEGFGGGGVVASAFGDVQVAGVLEGCGDGGAEGGQVDRPVAGPAGPGR